jgi:hypothetical protein
MRDIKTKPRTIGHGAAYIDPLHCGSSVRYRAAISRWGCLTMEIAITDCDRQVKWELRDENENPGVNKIDAAIALLTEARALWLKSLQELKVEQARRKRLLAKRKKKK